MWVVIRTTINIAMLVVVAPIAFMLLAPAGFVWLVSNWWDERRLRARLTLLGRTLDVREAEARLAAGAGTLLRDELSRDWWWSPERVEVPTRAYGPAWTREEAKAIVADATVMFTTRDRWCAEDGQGSLVVGSRRALRALAARSSGRVAVISAWLMEEWCLDWDQWMPSVTCARCGYDLSGLEVRVRCPECGGVKQRWEWQGEELRGWASVGVGAESVAPPGRGGSG